MPCTPLVINLVLSPLKKSPLYPSLFITSLNACLYVICSFEACFIVFNTRIELEIVSETKVHQKPIKALLKIAFIFYYLKLYLGR